jgi:hypothetical protein
MNKRAERKRIMLMEESATQKANAAVENEVQKQKEQNTKNMMKKMGVPSAPKLSNIQGMPSSYKNSLKMKGGKSKRKKKLEFTSEKIEEFKNMLMQIANMNMKQITY